MSSEVSASTATDDDDDVPVDLGARVRRIVAVPGRLLACLLIPDKAIPREVSAQRYGAALLAVIFCGLIGQSAISMRIDVSADILQQAAKGMGGPDDPGAGNAPSSSAGQGEQAASTKSDREIQDEITKTQAVERVTRLLNFGAWKPFKYSFMAVLLFLLFKFVGGTPVFKKTYSATIHATLPYAVKSLVIAGAALSQASLTPAQADTLVDNPIAPAVAGLGNLGVLLATVDPFMLWTVGLLALGMASAAEISRKRAFITMFVGFALFLGLSAFFAHAGGGGGGPQMEGNR